MKHSFIVFCLIFPFSNLNLFAQVNIERRIPSPALPFLTIAPDARSAGMGEAGVALSADANATFWNASKLPFAEGDFGASASFTPWLRDLVDDQWIGYASVYKKIGEKQAIAGSVNYFKQSDYTPFRVGSSNSDIAVNGTYARQLGKNFSMGITAKYIVSSVMSPMNGSAFPTQKGKVLAGDLSAYYRKQIINEQTGGDLTWSLGAVLSNFGGKINYGPGTSDQFIPTTLKIGGGLSFAANSKNRFNFIVDAGKLMVPTPISGINVNDKPLLKGMFGSFSDAPDGFKEEMQEIGFSVGAEYMYKSTFAFRGGYHGESKYKGDRKYFTAGAGVRVLKYYLVDIAYLIPAQSYSPLSKTYRVSLSAYFGKTRS